MTIYLSGPMSGYSENNKSIFNHWANYFRERGHKVINPCEFPHVEDFCCEATDCECEWTYDYYIALSLKLLESADAVYMIEGWKESNGAKLEHKKAVDLMLAVMGEV